MSRPCQFSVYPAALTTQCGLIRSLCAGAFFGLLRTAMPAEDARRRKLTQLVADHIFGHEYLDELVAVVNFKIPPHKLRPDRTPPRPALVVSVRISLRRPLPLLVQFRTHDRPFFQTASHASTPVGRPTFDPPVSIDLTSCRGA